MKPAFDNTEFTEADIEAAGNAGLPAYEGKQVMASAIRHYPDGKSVMWYGLEDGSEIMKDQAGKKITAWPLIPEYKAPVEVGADE